MLALSVALWSTILWCGCRYMLPWFCIGACTTSHEASEAGAPWPLLLLGLGGSEEADAWLLLSTSPLAPAELPSPSSEACSAVSGFRDPVLSCIHSVLDAWLDAPVSGTMTNELVPEAVLLGP